MVKSRGPLPVVHACYFIYQAALGLQHAHERGMVHRDIKPANLIFAREGKKGVVKVLDFGLAKVTSEGQADSGLTREGQMLGTPDYIAPEQIRDAQSADIRADIYSLGCTFYYLLTGGPPFRGDHLWDLYQAHFSMEAGPLNLVRPEVPVELAAVVAKMMAKEPRRRFQTPGEVAQALTPFFKKGSVGARVSNVEVSQVGQPEGRPESPAKGSVPTQPATNLEPAAASPVKKTAAKARPEPQWESLIELKETEPAKVPAPDVAVLKRPIPRWLLPAVAAGVLVLGLVVAWGVILRVKTANGMIELVNLPKDAEVLVDGEEVAVTWPGGGKPAVITVTAGKHKVMVKKDGTEISGDEVTVQAEGKEKFTVRFVPPTKPPHELPKDDGADSTRTANKDARPDAVPAVKTPSSQESIKNSIGMTFELIPAGEFLMGSPDNHKDAEKNEKPQHRVRITRPFYLGVYEVTQAQYEAVMGNNPSYFSANGGGSDSVAGQSTDRHPVENVSWLDAVKFCNKLGEMEGRPPFYEIEGENVRVPDWSRPGYRLPTEAEWEYACRANAPTVTRYSFGDDEASLGEFAWYKGNSGGKTHPVGEKRPNGFGLFDMHGNVCEWCWDGYGEGYYKESREDDPRGLDGAAARVRRGGSWHGGPRYARSADRMGLRPVGWLSRLGFRVARSQAGMEVGDQPPVAPAAASVGAALRSGGQSPRVPTAIRGHRQDADEQPGTEHCGPDDGTFAREGFSGGKAQRTRPETSGLVLRRRVGGRDPREVREDETAHREYGEPFNMFALALRKEMLLAEAQQYYNEMRVRVDEANAVLSKMPNGGRANSQEKLEYQTGEGVRDRLTQERDNASRAVEAMRAQQVPAERKEEVREGLQGEVVRLSQGDR